MRSRIPGGRPLSDKIVRTPAPPTGSFVAGAAGWPVLPPGQTTTNGPVQITWRCS